MSFQTFAIRLLAAFLAGAAVGLERQIHGRPAGLRTHVLVATGSAVAVMAGLLASGTLPGGMDTGRIAAGVVTGIGFLGAGTIVRYREGVGGLTTAACIWFIAMAGILAGLGFTIHVMLVTALAMAVLVLLDRLEDRIPSASYWRFIFVFREREFSGVYSECRELIRRHGFTVRSSTASVTTGETELVFVLRTRRWKNLYELVDAAESLKGIVSVKWIHRTEAI